MRVSASVARRLVGRLRTRRLSRVRVAVAALAGLALVAAAGWVLLASSLLGVRTVRVEGARRVDAARVASVAAVRVGTPLARLDTASVVARVERLAAVRSAEVRRSWPGTVAIVVHERVPAAVRPRGSGFALVDRGGVAFAAVRRRPAGLPLVSAPVDAGPPALRAALDVLESLPPSVRDRVKAVRAATVAEVTVRLTRHRTVVWGSTARGERKAAVLAVLIGRKARVYDVSVPDAPTTRR